MIDPLTTAKRLAASGFEPSNGTPDSGFKSQDNLNDVTGEGRNGKKQTSENRKSGQTSLKGCIYNALCDSSDTDSRSQSTGGATTTEAASLSSQGNPMSLSNAIITPRMSFSPADSLDSNVTLVSEIYDEFTANFNEPKTTKIKVLKENLLIAVSNP